MIQVLRSGRARYWLEGLFATPVLILFYHTIYLEDRYTWDMPQPSDVPSGRTVAMTVNYNRIVFVTESEQRILTRAYWFTRTGFAIVAFYALIREIRPRFFAFPPNDRDA